VYAHYNSTSLNNCSVLAFLYSSQSVSKSHMSSVSVKLSTVLLAFPHFYSHTPILSLNSASLFLVVTSSVTALGIHLAVLSLELRTYTTVLWILDLMLKLTLMLDSVRVLSQHIAQLSPHSQFAHCQTDSAVTDCIHSVLLLNNRQLASGFFKTAPQSTGYGEGKWGQETSRRLYVLWLGGDRKAWNKDCYKEGLKFPQCFNQQ
jgi:hypothetical protein